MAASQDWDIQSRSDRCTATSIEFDDGQVIWSRLRYTEDGYVREDFSEDGWESMEDKAGLSAWQGVFRAPPPKAEEPFKKENAETLLRRLMETEDEQYLNTIYILAVMLERKRLLVEQDVRLEEDGTKWRVYEHKASGESMVIRDPELKLAELAEVQDEVVVMLGGTPPGKKKEPESAPEGAPENPPEESPPSPDPETD